MLALPLALLALVALPARTLAQTHKGVCRPSATAQHKHGGSACVPSRHSAAANKGTKTRSKTSSKLHPRRRRTGSWGSTGASQATPICEDGSAPTSAGSGSFTCADGSEPECEDGATPVLAKGGAKLLCAATVRSGRESGSALLCDDGSLPTVAADGSYSCADGSEPECEAGPVPVLSSDGSTIVCQLAAGSEAED